LQAPFTQAFTVHTLLSSHTPQAAPPSPHWPAVSAAIPTHVDPFKHPVQHVRYVAPDSWLQIPLLPPAVQAVPWLTLTWVHPPAVQVSSVQGLPSSHVPHAPPPSPHCVGGWFPSGTQVLPVQQPEQHAAMVPPEST
jgi:hypothetical protein